jgi:hypothetical protein
MNRLTGRGRASRRRFSFEGSSSGVPPWRRSKVIGQWATFRQVNSILLPLEILHRLFVLFRRGPGFERAQVAPFSGLRIFLPRIQPVTAFDFPNHGLSLRVPSFRRNVSVARKIDRLRSVSGSFNPSVTKTDPFGLVPAEQSLTHCDLCARCLRHSGLHVTGVRAARPVAFRPTFAYRAFHHVL